MSQLEQTVSRYRSLRLSAAADELINLLAEAEANEMSYLGFADRLAEHELVQRQDKRIRRNRKMAAFPAEKRLEGFDYRHQTTITKRQVNALLDFQLINSLYEYRSIILTTTKNLISWGEFFRDDNVEVPIIDRTIQPLTLLVLGGETLD